MCPQCRIVNNENFSRNRVLEDISRKLFPEVSGIDDATAEVSNEVAPMMVDDVSHSDDCYVRDLSYYDYNDVTEVRVHANYGDDCDYVLDIDISFYHLYSLSLVLIRNDVNEHLLALILVLLMVYNHH